VRSRTKKAQGAYSGAPSQPSATAGSPGRSPQAPAAGGRNEQPDGSPNPDSATAAVPAGPRTSRRSLKNWRVRSRLLLLIIIPTVSAIGLGGISIASSVRSFEAYQRVDTLSALGQRIAVLAQALEDERDQTAFFIGMGTTGGRAASTAQAAPAFAVVDTEFAATNRSAAQVRALADQIGGSYSVQAQQAAATALTALKGLPQLRLAATKTQLPALDVVQEYTQVIDDVLALDDQISQGASDPQLAQTVRALGLVSTMQEDASQQRAILAAALWQGGFGAGDQTALQDAQSAQQSNLTAFDASASIAQQRQWNASVDGAFSYQASADEQQAISLQNGGHSLRSDPTTPVDWYGAMSNTVDAQMGSVARDLAASAAARARVLRNEAITTAVVVGIVVVLALLLALIFITIIGRSMVRPLRALRAGALKVAGVRLPEAVRQMNEGDGTGVSLDVEPIDVDSSDEIGEVARAFDQVHREALRLAANEAALRGNVNAMFVNLSRRSQSLVERQIHLIDDLEQGEQDDQRLSSLFQMDHLATRMRRNSENLLVLAGHDSSRRWNQPVALVDVLRASVSEIEQYERVSLNVQPGISVRGHAVNDAVHLLAELAENATSFSSAETPVTISGHLLSSGGVLLDITDHGVGMGAEEMAHANWRLDNPPVVDVAVSRRMGLFVVARLAARHGVRVRLRPAASGGLTALVWLPDEVVSRDGAAGPAGSRMPDAPAESISLSMPGLGDHNGSMGTDERSATAQEVNAARTPKFSSLQSGTGENGSALGPRRVPGSGPRPGANPWTPSATGPMSAFRTSPQPAGEAGDEPSATAPQHAVGADAFDSGLASAGPAGSELANSGFTGAGPLPALDPDVFGGWPEPAGTQPPPAEPDGSGQQLPKRQVDRTESSDSAVSDLFPTGSTDMFTTSTERHFGGGRFGTGSEPAPEPPESSRPAESADVPESAEPAGAGTGSRSVFSAPVSSAPVSADASTTGTTNGSNGFSWDAGLSGDKVVIPPAEHTSEYRLPIFEAVESDWFRRGRSSVGWTPQEPVGAGSPAADPEKANWTSPADEGWQAAAAVAAPSSSGVTPAGLPKRVPQANLVPGTAGAGAEAPAPAPARSASVTRDRFSSFQRGIREGRAAAGGDSSTGEDDGSR
jgi:signal transduction histidine kinase